MNNENAKIENQDQFNQYAVKALRDLYLSTMDTDRKGINDADFRLALSTLDDYAWRAEYERFEKLSEPEKLAELELSRSLAEGS